MRVVLYKPLNKVFRNRKEQKRYFGTHQMYVKWHKNRDDFVILNLEDSVADYEFVYPDASVLD